MFRSLSLLIADPPTPGRTPAPQKLFKEYNSLVGSLRHVVKYRPDISAAMDLLGCCLTFPTEELLKCAYHTLVYLARTRKLGVTYSKHAPNAFKLAFQRKLFQRRRKQRACFRCAPPLFFIALDAMTACT